MPSILPIIYKLYYSAEINDHQESIGRQEGEGPSFGKSKLTQEMRIHRESLHKEQVNERINEEFQINRPANVHFHTEKPNNNPYLLMKLREEGRTVNGVDYDEKLRDGNYKTELTS